MLRRRTKIMRRTAVVPPIVTSPLSITYLCRMIARLLSLTLGLAAAAVAAAQPAATVAARDSLMAAAAAWRDAANYTEAINAYSRVPTAEARLAVADTYLEMGNVVAALERARLLRRDKSFPLREGAMLVEARCRLRQGFDGAAMRILRRLARAGNAEAMYYYARHLASGGHMVKATRMCQGALAADPSLVPAHLLLFEAEAALGHRYQALLPLTAYLLMASDEGRADNAPRLVEMWRRGWAGLDVLGRRTPQQPYSELMEQKMDSIGAAIPARGGDPAETLRALAARTDALLAAMRETGEENMDFWQVRYADFLIELHARGYVEAMTRFFFSGIYTADVLAWVSENAGYFDDFRVWLSGRAAGF